MENFRMIPAIVLEIFIFEICHPPNWRFFRWSKWWFCQVWWFLTKNLWQCGTWKKIAWNYMLYTAYRKSLMHVYWYLSVQGPAENRRLYNSAIEKLAFSSFLTCHISQTTFKDFLFFPDSCLLVYRNLKNVGNVDLWVADNNSCYPKVGQILKWAFPDKME